MRRSRINARWSFFFFFSSPSTKTENTVLAKEVSKEGILMEKEPGGVAVGVGGVGDRGIIIIFLFFFSTKG